MPHSEDSPAPPFADAFDGLADGLLLLDAEGMILAANPAFERVWERFGVSLAGSLSFTENLETAAALGRAGIAADSWLARHRAAASETAAVYTVAMPGGSVLRLSETATAAARRLLSCRDVTAEVRREAELRDSEYRYRLLVETMSEGLILLDRNRRIAYANRRFLAWYGSGDMALLGHPVETLTEASAHRRLAALFAATAPQTVEIPLLCADGSRRHVLVSAAPLRGADGGVTGHFAIITDVTGLREANERLQQSEERFRGMVEHISFGILTLDAEGRILAANPAFRAIAGDDCAAAPAADLLPAAEPPLAEAMATLDRDPAIRAATAESRLRRADGETGDARLVLTRLGDDGAARYLLVVEDVTEQRRIEKALHHASKLALLGEMSASLAHEISQPLNIIRLAAETAMLALDEGDASTIREKFEIIGGQSDRLRETIDYIQAFSRRDTGAKRCFDLRQAIANVAGLLAPQCAGGGIRLVRDLPDAPLPVLGQPHQAEQVLLNLLRNAIDAIAERRKSSPGGDDEIAVRATAEAGTVAVEIADTGTGIRPEDMAHLFDPFFTRKSEGKGTGLGLSISLNLIGGMGGRIAAENRAEGGCRFRIVLPLADRPVEAPAAPPPPAASAARPAAEAARLSILVVDDEVLATQEIAAYLRKRGHAVATAADGTEARARLAEADVDILITDLHMPGGGGHDLMAFVAAEYPHVAIVVITGQPLRDREALAQLESGADAVLRKPVSLRELDETLGTLV